jgi:hypothetical protein
MKKRKPKKEDIIAKTKILILTKTNSWKVLKQKKALLS